MMRSKIAAIIPAKGTSKRLPRKNVLPLCGRPMIHYPLQAARKSGIFDRILVSSEDEQILDLAEQEGAEKVPRPPELSTDKARVVEVVIHVLDSLLASGQQPEEFCVIYPTAVLITHYDLRGGYELLQSQPETDVVMAVSEYDKSPYLALKEKDGFLQRMWPEYIGKYRWELPRLVVSSGTFYWARSNSFRENRSFYGKRTMGYFLPFIRSVDIDTDADYQLAESILKNRLNDIHAAEEIANS